jgi:hypothetical protein
MIQSHAKPITAAIRLRAALEATAASLRQPNLDGLLAAEADLTAAFTELSLLRSLDEAGRRAVHDELVAAHAALQRARRLGDSLGEFVRISLTARGDETGYGPGAAHGSSFTGRGLKVSA